MKKAQEKSERKGKKWPSKKMRARKKKGPGKKGK